MGWKRENCPPLPDFAVQAIAAIEAPAHCCEIEGQQECDEDDEYHHGLFFLVFSAFSFTKEYFNIYLDTCHS